MTYSGRTRNGLRVLGVAMVALCAPAVFGPATAEAQTVTVGSEGAIPPLDPGRMTGSVGLRVIDALFDPLVREDLSKATAGAPPVIPALAESWEVSEDGRTYTFTLRPGVTFHDGTPFDAAAVQTNFERLMKPDAPVFDERASGNMTFLTTWIESTEAVDGGTFRITLKEPFSGLLRLLTDRRMSIVSPAALAAYPGDELGFRPIGTGPFRLDEFMQGQTLSLQRNADYWRGEPAVAELVFRPITDPTALAIAMQTGELDIIPSASAEQVAQLSSEPGLKVIYPEPPNAYYIRLNAKAEFTSDVRFRQALNYAVNRDLVAALFGGQAAPATTAVPFGNEIADAAEGKIEGYSYDPDRAKALIAETGFETPIQLDILAPNSGAGFGLATQLVTLVQQDFKAVGVELNPQYLEFATLVSTERAGYADDINGSYNGWATGADSAYWLERMFGGSQQPPRGVNRGWYQSEAVDALFGQARAAVDPAERDALYVEAARQITEDAPWVFLYQDRLPRIVRDRVGGVSDARSLFIDYAGLTAD